MSDLSRHRPYLIWGAGIVGVAIVAVLALVPSGAWVALDQRRSSLRTTPDGVGAWARSLEQLSVPVRQRYRSFTDEPPSGAGLVILEPVLAPTAAEVHAALQWVREGGTLVYSPSRGGLMMDSVGIELTSWADETRVVGSARDSLLPHRWTGEGLAGPTNSAWALTADSVRERTWVPLSMNDEAGLPTLAWLPEGEGGLLVLADAEELANRTLDSSVSAIAATRAVVDRMAAGDTLFFSEYHQALDGRRGVFRETYALAKSSSLGRATLHAAVAAAFLLLLAGRRFGSPLPVPEGERRSTLEHVEALARIYKAARSHGAVARRLIRGAARRMGLPPSSGADSEAEMLVTWGSRPELAEPAAGALTAFGADPPDLATLESALDAIVARHASPPPRP